jgi:ankyrin repeat protein
VNARTQDQWAPIHLSAYNRHLDLVKLLLERGADVDAMDGRGDTPHQLLLQGGYREMADLLRVDGAGRAARQRFDEVRVMDELMSD